jgi:hypothetical protein
MVSLLNFIREWMDIRRESKSYCKSCEILKEQLAASNFEKKHLLERFVFTTPASVESSNIRTEPILPKIIPWKIQRELLEAEDRAKAASIRRAREEQEKARLGSNQSGNSIESNSISVDELEKELGVQ